MPGQAISVRCVIADRGPYIHDYFWNDVKDQLQGSASYQYGPPDLEWHRFGIEAQATIVNESIAGMNGVWGVSTRAAVGWRAILT